MILASRISESHSNGCPPHEIYRPVSKYATRSRGHIAVATSICVHHSPLKRIIIVAMSKSNEFETSNQFYMTLLCTLYRINTARAIIVKPIIAESVPRLVAVKPNPNRNSGVARDPWVVLREDHNWLCKHHRCSRFKRDKITAHIFLRKSMYTDDSATPRIIAAWS